ncbi:MAG: ChaN family lipoprotein [Acidobacteriota bacterium]
MKTRPVRREEIRVRKAAVRSLKRIISGVDQNSGRKYIRDFMRDYASYAEPASYDDLVIKGFRSDIVYVGDYHALPSCQAFFSRYLLDLIQRSAHVVVAMEMIFARHQRILDDWMARRLDDEDFLLRIRYEEEWGYEWAGYRAILDVARREGVRVVGLDCGPRSGFRVIRRRDAHAAERICEIFLREPQAKVVAFVGESHLARNHLPQRVYRAVSRCQLEKRSLTIVQNIDALYWQRMETGMEDVDVVRVEGDRYCVFSASPMAKYEAYRQVIERWNRQPSDAGDEVDLTPTVHNMIESILEFLHINRFRFSAGRREGVPIRLVNVFPEVYTHEDPDFIAQMLQRHGLDRGQIDRVLAHLARSGSCYVPRVNVIFLGTLDLTHSGEEASHFVNAALKGELYENWTGKPMAGHDCFYSAVMEEAIGYFGSKLIDPARNHFFETDFYQYYGKDPETVEKCTGYSFSEFRTIIDFILLHKKFEKDYQERSEVPAALLEGIRATGALFSILTHELGYFLGQQIYDGFQKGLVPQAQITALYRQKWGEPSSALSTYLDWTEQLRPLGGG